MNTPLDQAKAIEREPARAGIIGIVTVVLSYFAFVLFLVARQTTDFTGLFSLVLAAPVLMIAGALGGARFFRHRSLGHLLWIIPALFVLYNFLLGVAR